MDKTKQNQAEKSIAAIKKELAKQTALAQEYLAGWQRAKADFLNYKKSEIARQQKISFETKVNLMLKLLTVLDNFNEAFAKIDLAKIADSEKKLYFQGFLNIKRQFEQILASEGLREITIKPGDQFDPSIAEAVEVIESKIPGNKIVAVLQKGYLFKDKILRPAKVQVSKGKSD